MNNSSDMFIQRRVWKKNETLPIVPSKRTLKYISPSLLAFFKYLLSTSILWLQRFFLVSFVDPEEGTESSELERLLSAEKAEFSKKYAHEYGFPDGPVSVDQLRAKEFTRLKGKVYLDHAGATLYTETQIKATISDFSSNLYGNPHSQNESSNLSSDLIDSARNQVLAMCKASPDEYRCVFTSGATGALKLVGEIFPWSGDSHYMYTMENHNSVVGIREYALSKGATVTPVYLDHNRVVSSRGAKVSEFHVRQQSPQKRNVFSVAREGGAFEDEERCNLFAFPLECNFSGAKFDLGVIPFVQQRHHVKDEQRGKWLVLLDAAKGCSTAPPNLSRFPADFVAISFYKIFGYPTGLGALLIRKDAAKLMKKDYFGGGTVAAALADEDFMQRRSRVENWLEDGTVSFLGIAALRHGFRIIHQLQMPAINRHTGSLASYLAAKLHNLKHWNGTNVCVLYGNHNNAEYWGSHCKQGPIVSFNLKRADDSWIGPREVEKLATLRDIHLRTGCFCNPGACSKYLGLSRHEMKKNFEAGHVYCDDKDLIDGYPTGAVRVSFGYMNTFEDCWAFIQFISKFFVEQRWGEAYSLDGRVTNSSTASSIPEKTLVSLQSIVVYPIKSCGGFAMKSWPLGDYGLLYDREWLLMSVSGEILTQKRCPSMCFIQTHIDLESGSLHVQAPNMQDELNIPLLKDKASRLANISFRNLETNDSGLKCSAWFTEALGISCRLIRRQGKSGVGGNSIPGSIPSTLGDASATKGADERSFANEGQFLLVSQDSVEDLNRRLASSGHKAGGQYRTSTGLLFRTQVDAAHFRPNLVVAGSIPYDEDNWQSFRIGDQKFQVMRRCNRCKVVNIDQETGKTQASGEPLATLASYRRVKGQIYFGILVEQDRNSTAMDLSSNHLQTRSAVDQASIKCANFDTPVKTVGSRVLEVGQRLYVVASKLLVPPHDGFHIDLHVAPVDTNRVVMI